MLGYDDALDASACMPLAHRGRAPTGVFAVEAVWGQPACSMATDAVLNQFYGILILFGYDAIVC